MSFFWTSIWVKASNVADAVGTASVEDYSVRHDTTIAEDVYAGLTVAELFLVPFCVNC